MCQSASGESDFLQMRDYHIRKKGYDAFKRGEQIESCKEDDHPNPKYSDKKIWECGWNLAREGKGEHWL